MAEGVSGAFGRVAAVVLTAALAAFGRPAAAQDAEAGAQLYRSAVVIGQRSCGNVACHGTLPRTAQNKIANGRDASAIAASIANQRQMAFLTGRLSNEQLNDLAAYIAQQLGGTPVLLPVPPRPRPALTPASLNFGVQPIAIATPAQTVTLTNGASATAALTLSAITLAGSDFALAGGTCTAGQVLAAGQSCTVALSFRPTIAGTRSGTLTLAHDAGSSTVALTGLGGNQSPSITLSPTQLTFSQTVGGSSASQRVVVGNTGNAGLVIEALVLGGAQAAEFSVAAGSGCSAGSTVAVGANCSVDLVFTPAAAGTRSATLTLRHNAGSGSSLVALVGQANAAPAPALTLDATRLDLGTQALGLAGTPRTLTLGNRGEANLVFSAFTLRGLHAADIVQGGSCAVGTPVAPGGSCAVTLALRPSALGTRSAQLEIASNTPTGTATVSLQGDAIATPAPALALSQPALGFGRVTLATTSVARQLLLANAGSAPLAITSLASSSAEFGLTHDCPASLDAGARCTLAVTYTPAAPLATERITIVSNAFSSPNSVVLTGEGASGVLPVLAWVDAGAALDFGSAEVGTPSATRTLTLRNQGPGEAVLSSIVIVGNAPEAFSLAGGTCTGGAVRLAADATCTVQLQFVPDEAGARSALLLAASDGSNPPELPLAGTGSAAGSGGGGGGGDPGGGGGGGGGTPFSPFALDRARLDFGPEPVRTGSRSGAQSVRITNRGTATATIRAVDTSSGFVLAANDATDACRGVPWTLAPGASCTVAVVFAPSVGGPATGTLAVTAEDGSVLELPLAAEAKTEITNTGAGAQGAPWLLALAFVVVVLIRIYLFRDRR